MARFLAAGGSELDPRNPLLRWMSRITIEMLHDEFEAGDGMALWYALNEIAIHNFRPPRWVRDALGKGCSALLEFRAHSLEEAFGAPHEKGTNVPALRNRYRWSFQVHRAVMEMVKKGHPRTDATFSQIAERFDIGVGRVKEYFYEVEKLLNPHSD